MHYKLLEVAPVNFRISVTLVSEETLPNIQRSNYRVRPPHVEQNAKIEVSYATITPSNVCLTSNDRTVKQDKGKTW